MTPVFPLEDQGEKNVRRHVRPLLGTGGIDPADRFKELHGSSKRISVSHELFLSTLGDLDDDPNLLQEIYQSDDDAVEYTFDEPATHNENDGSALEDEIPSKLANLEERASEIARFSETLSLDGYEKESANEFHDSESGIGSTSSTSLADMFGEMNASAGLHSVSVPESILISDRDNETTTAIKVEERPFLVHKSDSAEIYRINNTGIKVIVGDISLEEQNKKLDHERNMSNFLSSTSRRRKVIEKKEFDGRAALWFEWEEGVTLKKWLQNREVDLNSKVRVAMAIAKTLSEFHDEGVFYNNLSCENIVLNTVEGADVATFIDLSKSGFIDMRPNADKEYTDMLRSTDLKMMGNVFRAIFHGEDPNFEQCQKEESAHKKVVHDNDTCDSHHRKRGKPSSLPSNLSNLPLYINSLITALVASCAKSSSGYSCAKDVLLDLKRFSENPNSNVRKYHVDESSIVQRSLQLGGGIKFYGRQVQLTMIQHFFESVIRNESCPLMSVVSGCPGAGKSTSVNEVKSRFRGEDLLLIEGKFNKFSRPDSVLTSALNSIFANMAATSNSSNALQSMKQRICDAFEYENELYDAIPQLLVFLQGGSLVPNSPPTFGGKKSNQLVFMLCRLIGAIASDEIPVVLYLDDLQWADQATLDLIGMLMLDPNIQHFGILGCYRDNEVDRRHPLFGLLEAVRLNGIDLTEIHVGPIERESVNSIVSDALCLPPSLCRPLSTVIHQKAGGVILFVIRFLNSLNKQGHLVYCLESRRWTWDLEKIKSERVSEDFVVHTTLQMISLPQPFQTGLMIAACLGSNFNGPILRKAIEENELDVDSFIISGKDGGYIEESESGSYRWTHDQIQQAAYNLILPTQRESFHYHLGRRLLKNSTNCDMNGDFLFMIVENMNRGTDLKLNRDEMTQLARLNLQAGNEAMSTSGFHSAAKYLQQGINLLSKDSWIHEYDLTIQLYDAALDTYYTVGQFSNFEVAVKQPLTHAICFEDKLNSYHHLVRFLTASGRSEEALETCLSVLKKLGEEIAPNADIKSLLAEASCVKQMIRNSSIDDVLDLPKLKDSHKIAKISFLSTAIRCSFEMNQVIFAIIICRMVKLSLQHGLHSISADAFSLYGALLTCPTLSDFDEAYKMGRLALRAIDRLNAFRMKPNVFLTFYGAIAYCKEPVQASIPKLLEGYEVAFALGDMERVTGILQLYASVAVWGCGDKLTKAEEIIRIHLRRMLQHKQDVSCKNILPHLNQIAKLTGSKENVYVTFFNTTEENFFEEEMNRRGAHTRKLILHTCRIYLAVMCGDMESAAHEYERNGAKYQGGIRFFGTTLRVFLAGIVGFYLARKRRLDQKKWAQVGEISMNTIKSWTQDSSWNYAHKLLLLEAECLFLKGEEHEHLAAAKYNESIAVAKKHKFKNDEGLASQKAAMFHLEYNRKEEALSHLKHAKACYECWGATGLANQIKIAIESLSSQSFPKL